MGSSKFKPHWTLVQHSGYSYGGDSQFQKGVEERQVSTAREAERITKAGGVLLDSYLKARDLAMKEMYPSGEGLIPDARGTFNRRVLIGRLPLYVPAKA
jgi:hypothetical protein